MLALMLSTISFPNQANAVPRFGEWGSPQSCTPQVKYIADFRVVGDLGYLKPDGLVQSGSLVKLDGTAVKLVIDSHCRTRTTPIPFSWGLSFTSKDGTRTSPPLIDRGTLNPSFQADDTGKYSVSLSTQFIKKRANVFSEDATGGSWISIGPDNIAGRITAIAMDPVTKFFYAGAETGGLWRSMDGTRSWQALSDNGVVKWKMPNIKINTVAITRVNDVTSIFAGLDVGGGIWIYSPDGSRWERSGANTGSCQNSELKYSSVYKIIAHPSNPLILYAGTDHGVFRTPDKGSCWVKVLGPAWEYLPIQDLVVTKSQVPTIYAAKQGGFVLKATDNDPASWIVLNDQPGSGLPTSSLGGRTAIAASDSDPNVLYMGYEPPGSHSYKFFKSTSGGVMWTELSSPPNRCDGQCDHNNQVAVSPTNPNVVIIGQVPLYTSVDGGYTWVDSSIPNQMPGPEKDYGMHSDILSLTFDPFNSSKLYVGTDGGIYDQTVDINNPRPYWKSISNELVTSQFYDSGQAPKERALVSGGTQDNSNVQRKDAKAWTFIPESGGDGFQTEFDQESTYTNPITYTNSYWGSSGGGSNILQHSPALQHARYIADGYSFFANPYRSTLAVIGTDGQLYHADLRSGSAIVKCIDPTPDNSMDRITSVFFVYPGGPNSDYMFIGTLDGSIYVVVVPDGTSGTACGASNRLVVKMYYDRVIPGCVAPNSLNDLTQNPHFGDPDIVYATFSNSTKSDRVVRIDAMTAGNEKHWCGTDITGDLPSGLIPDDIAVDPVQKGLIHLGTTQGIFMGQFNASESRWHWSPAKGSPPVDITSLEMQWNSKTQPPVIRASTYGRGVLEFLRPIPQSLTSLQGQAADAISNCSIREFDSPNDNERIVSVDIQYSYNPSHGKNVSITPVAMKDGKDIPFFLNEAETLNQSHGNASLMMMYAGSNSPLKLKTDAIRIEMLQPKTGIFVKKICNADLTWRNMAGRTLDINAIAIPPEGPTAPVNVPISISSSEAPTSNNSKGIAENTPQFNSPTKYTGEFGSKVNLTAPGEVKTSNNNSLKFYAWQINGSETITNPSISLVLRNDTNATAIYKQLEEKEVPRVIIRTTCSCTLEKNGSYSNSSIQDIPVQFIRGPDNKTIFTPADIGAKSSIVDLKAPDTIRGSSNLTLKFDSWAINNKEKQTFYEPHLSLTISSDTQATAHYSSPSLR